MDYISNTTSENRRLDSHRFHQKTNYKNFGFYTPSNIDNRFGATTSHGFRSQSSNKRDDFYIFNKISKKELFGADNEKLQETILQLKKEINNKTKEINALKVEVNLLNVEEKKKSRVIENILSSSGKSIEDVVNILDENKNIDKIDLTANSVIKLREIYVINFLKNQVSQLKSIIKEKDMDIKNFKENTKISKINCLENELESLKNENTQIKGNLERISFSYENLKTAFSNLKIEHESLYKKYLKKTRENEKINTEKIKIEEENKTLIKEKKKSEEDTNKYKLSMINMKADLKYKTDYCNFAKSSEEKCEKLEKEKEIFLRKIENLNKEKAKLKLENK